MRNISAIFRDKKNTSILMIVLFILVLSRIALYPIFGSGMVGTDAQMRYLPQVDELSQSIGSLFSQIGPAYSLFLLFFKEATHNLVASSVLVQHVIGLITGVLVFYYFKRVNLFLAAFVTVFIYSGWLALWLEHTILRESLTAFFLVLLIMIFSLAVKEEKYFKLPYSFLTGLTAMILVFFRIEFIFLVAFLPFVFFFAKKKSLNFKFLDKRFLKWSLGYLLPLLIVFWVYGAGFLKNNGQKDFQYGSLFGISYYSLAYHDFLPKIFYYENSNYPGLLESYRLALQNDNEGLNDLVLVDRREKVGKELGILDKSTKDYLTLHPEINLSANQLMDKIFIEIIEKNTLIYLKGLAVNFGSHLMGTAELNTVLSKDSQIDSLKIHLSGTEPPSVKDSEPVSLFDRGFRFYIAGMIIFSRILFWLFLISLPILFFKWKTMPPEIIISFFVVFLHLSILAIFADPSQRFRYPVDPFLYFLELYLIWYLLKILYSKAARLFVRK